jgi:lipocalin
MSTQQQYVKNCLLLQYLGFWYPLNHTGNTVEDQLDCVSVYYHFPPSGDVDYFEGFEIMWVYNMHSLFAALVT